MRITTRSTKVQLAQATRDAFLAMAPDVQTLFLESLSGTTGAPFTLIETESGPAFWKSVRSWNPSKVDWRNAYLAVTSFDPVEYAGPDWRDYV